MRFQVPQFIEVEDKIFGPLTLKQFVYLAGGAGLSFMIYRVLPSLLFAFIPILIVMGFSLALAFYKVNNKPFVLVVESAFKYFTNAKLYIWKKEPKTPQNSSVQEAKGYSSILVPKVSDSKLKDIAWSLDINESLKEKPVENKK